MRKVTFLYEEFSGTRPAGWKNEQGWFHKFVVIREDSLREDVVYAIVENKQGKVQLTRHDCITFADTPPTSDE